MTLPLLGCFGGGSLYGWSGYSPALQITFDANHAATSMVFSFALASFTLGVLLGPVLIAYLPQTMRLPLLAFAAAASLLAASLSTGFVGFAVFYGICFGGLSGVLYNYAVSVAAGSDYPTFLVPASVAAFGLGGAVFGPWAAALVAAGWALWSTLPAVICLAGIGAVSLIFAGQPQSTGSLATKARSTFARPDATTIRLWIIFASGSVTGLVVLGFAAQVLAHSTDGLALAAFAVFMVAAGNTLGRLAAAVVAKRFGPARAIAGALLISLGAVAVLMFATAAGSLLMLLFLIALGYGHVAASVPLLVRAEVGAQAFPGAFGLVFTGWGLAGLLGPWSAGIVLERTGSFAVVLVGCGLLILVSFACVLPYLKKGLPPSGAPDNI